MSYKTFCSGYTFTVVGVFKWKVYIKYFNTQYFLMQLSGRNTYGRTMYM